MLGAFVTVEVDVELRIAVPLFCPDAEEATELLPPGDVVTWLAAREVVALRIGLEVAWFVDGTNDDDEALLSLLDSWMDCAWAL
jgi:hypothetical protein